MEGREKREGVGVRMWGVGKGEGTRKEGKRGGGGGKKGDRKGKKGAGEEEVGW